MTERLSRCPRRALEERPIPPLFFLALSSLIPLVFHLTCVKDQTTFHTPFLPLALHCEGGGVGGRGHWMQMRDKHQGTWLWLWGGTCNWSSPTCHGTSAPWLLSRVTRTKERGRGRHHWSGTPGRGVSWLQEVSLPSALTISLSLVFLPPLLFLPFVMLESAGMPLSWFYPCRRSSKKKKKSRHGSCVGDSVWVQEGLRTLFCNLFCHPLKSLHLHLRWKHVILIAAKKKKKRWTFNS